MHRDTIRRGLFLAGGFLGAWLVLRYLLPVFLPFVLGLLLAVAAEPVVSFCVRLRLPRWASAGIGVSTTLLLLVALVGVIGAALVRELGVLTGRLPDLQTTAQEAAAHLRLFLEDAASRTPENVRPLVNKSVSRLFSSGTELVEQATVRLPRMVSGILGRVPDGALGVGTGILSGFMFSVRLPRFKKTVSEKMPESVKTQLLPAVKRAKGAVFGWLKAQIKISAITYGIVAVGFLVLRIPYGPLWAAAVALVDAVPLLGTGTVLLPWALVSLLQREHLRAIGILGIYGAAFFSRTLLEPRLVGRHLGIDPLVTLMCLYLGYRFWGILGMLFAPILAAALIAAGQNKGETAG